jgi:hypothetical protein
MHLRGPEIFFFFLSKEKEKRKEDLPRWLVLSYISRCRVRKLVVGKFVGLSYPTVWVVG